MDTLTPAQVRYMVRNTPHRHEREQGWAWLRRLSDSRKTGRSVPPPFPADYGRHQHRFQEWKGYRHCDGCDLTLPTDHKMAA